MDERTPLLSLYSKLDFERTPLPKLQIAIALLLQLCEPVCSLSINSFIDEYLHSLNCAGRTGHSKGEWLARTIESLYYAAEAITILPWLRISDRIGRKPVIMLGLLGVVVSMSAFGLSRTVLWLVISRCLGGLMNGNTGVVKSLMVELTDTTNRADVFGFIAPVSALGGLIALFLGSTLIRPAERFSSVFYGGIWSQFPYFLPCLAASMFVSGAILVSVLFFKETLSTREPISQTVKSLWASRSEHSFPRERPPPSADSARISLQDVLAFPVVISIASYAALLFMSNPLHSLIPVLFRMSAEQGSDVDQGLDKGLVLFGRGVYVLGTTLFQTLYFARLVRFGGSRRAFVVSVAAILLILLLLPVACAALKTPYLGTGGAVGFLGAAMLVLFLMDMAKGCILMCIIDYAPTPRSVRYVNGLAQTTAALVKALVGPASSSSISVLRVSHTSPGAVAALGHPLLRRMCLGWMYAFLVVLAILVLCLAVSLPRLPRSRGRADMGSGVERTDDKIALHVA